MRKRILFVDKSGADDAWKFVQAASRSFTSTSHESVCKWEIHWVGEEVPADRKLYADGGVGDESWQIHHTWDASQLKDFAGLLSLEPMGTKVSLFLAHSLWKELHGICTTCGLSSEDIDGQAYGSRLERVFCIGCYEMNPPSTEERISCKHCGRVLSVSTHYSQRLDAVFGYLAISQPAEAVSDDR